MCVDIIKKFKLSIRMWKKNYLSHFECGMVVGARLSSICLPETADVLGFSHTTVSSVCREWSKYEKIFSEQQIFGWKCRVDARGQRRMTRLVWDDRKATVTHYNWNMHKNTKHVRQLSDYEKSDKDTWIFPQYSNVFVHLYLLIWFISLFYICTHVKTKQKWHSHIECRKKKCLPYENQLLCSPQYKRMTAAACSLLLQPLSSHIKP